MNPANGTIRSRRPGLRAETSDRGAHYRLLSITANLLINKDWTLADLIGALRD